MNENTRSCSLNDARSALEKASSLRRQFVVEHKERSLLQNYLVPSTDLDPYRPNFYIAYCRMSDTFSYEIAALLSEIQYRLDELTDLREAIKDHSPKPFEFEIACVEEIEKEVALLMQAIKALDVSKYWDALLQKELH